MFGGLKEKLQAARSRLGSSIQSVITAPGSSGTGTAPQVSVPGKENQGSSPSMPVSPSLVDKFKVLVIEREMIISEKDISDALSGLELTLLESDVALPATDAIISHVRKCLVGKHRRIGESVDYAVPALVAGMEHMASISTQGQYR